jgi:hypothetical protein
MDGPMAGMLARFRTGIDGKARAVRPPSRITGTIAWSSP